MGFVLEGELIHSYTDQTSKGKTYTVHQVQFRAGKAITTISIKDFSNRELGKGEVRLPVFPDVWQGQRGPMVSWIAGRDSEEPKLQSVGGGKKGVLPS